MRALGFDDSDEDEEASVSSVQVVHLHIKSYLDFNRLRFVPDDNGMVATSELCSGRSSSPVDKESHTEDGNTARTELVTEGSSLNILLRLSMPPLASLA